MRSGLRPCAGSGLCTWRTGGFRRGRAGMEGVGLSVVVLDDCRWLATRRADETAQTEPVAEPWVYAARGGIGWLSHHGGPQGEWAVATTGPGSR